MEAQFEHLESILEKIHPLIISDKSRCQAQVYLHARKYICSVSITVVNITLVIVGVRIFCCNELVLL